MNNQIKEEIEAIDIPLEELSIRSKLGVKRAKSEMRPKVNKLIRTKLITAIVTVGLLIPTGAFAYQSLLADEIYGSFDQLKKHVSNATLKGYFLFDAKLSQAKGDMTGEEFEKFKNSLKVLTSSKLEYGNQDGNIDFSHVPTEQVEKYRKAMYEIQPYFDHLNGQKSTKEVLTPDEYEKYIDAHIRHEEIMAKSGITTSQDIEKVPTELQEEFILLNEYLAEIDEKKLQD
jgi:hypothetical protein